MTIPQSLLTSEGVRPMTKASMIGVSAITLCQVSRCYGGPEEGGWYYDHYSPLRVFYVPKARAWRLRDLLERLADKANEGAPPLWSVASNGLVRIVEGVELETERPHY